MMHRNMYTCRTWVSGIALLLVVCSSSPVTMDVIAKPILLPDLSLCQKAVAKSPNPSDPTNQTLNCCLPYKKINNIVDFTFQKYPAPKTPRVRRPAHLADNHTIARLNKAYEIMKSLDRDDPRSFRTQANLHCAFCNGAYNQYGTNITLQVHFSWFFFPWHRMYLYFHERILASLIGDDPNNPTFGLLYWNWDNQFDDLKSNVMPPAFTVKNSALFDAKRNRQNMKPDQRIRLNLRSSTDDSAAIIEENLSVMYHSVVTPSDSDMFMGGAYRQGTDLSSASPTNQPMAGAMEINAHTGVHYWAGDPNRKLRSDMGVFTLAGRDPLFYAHHGNVDRLWEVWGTLDGGSRHAPVDTDFLDAEFYFYDENSNLVRAKVRDFLDNEKLGISYEHLEHGDRQWAREFSPKPSGIFNGSAVDFARKNYHAQDIQPATPNTTVSYTLGSNFTAIVKRDPVKAADTRDYYDEVLLIQGLLVERYDYVNLEVFLNLPGANQTTSIFVAEYVGSANIVPTDPPGKLLNTDVELEIGDNIRLLGLQNEESIVVTVLLDSQLAVDPSTLGITFRGMEVDYVRR